MSHGHILQVERVKAGFGDRRGGEGRGGGTAWV